MLSALQHLAGAADEGDFGSMWSALGALVDRSPGLGDLRAHGLHLFAAAWWRRSGRLVPAELRQDERRAAIRVLAVRSLLERIRSSCDGPIVLIKGYEVALRYPEPTLRPFGDVDLLVPDPEGVFRTLVAAGFEPVGHPDSYYDRLHHLRPLRLPQLPIVVEIHRRPEWVRWSAAPPIDEIVAHAVPSRSGVDGVLAPAAAHHALVVAAHSWSGLPLRRVSDIVDAGALALEAPRGELERWSSRWDVDGLWRFTEKLWEALFAGGRPPASMRVWGRTAFTASDATVIEQHARRLLGPFAVLPVHRALRDVATVLLREIMPAEGETWSAKLARVRLARRNAFVARSHHEAALLERRQTKR